MNRPHPLAGVLALAGWIALSVACSVVLLPAHPLLNTCVWGASVLLFAAAVAAPLRSLPLAGLGLAVSGVSSLAFGFAHPVVVAPVPLAAYLAGAALRAMYDVERPAGAPRSDASLAGGRGRRGPLGPVGLRRGANLLPPPPGRPAPARREPPRPRRGAGRGRDGGGARRAPPRGGLPRPRRPRRAGRPRRAPRRRDARRRRARRPAGRRSSRSSAWCRTCGPRTGRPGGARSRRSPTRPPRASRRRSSSRRASPAPPRGRGSCASAPGAGARASSSSSPTPARGEGSSARSSRPSSSSSGRRRARLAGQKPGVRRRIALSAGTLSILVALAFGAALAWPTGEGSRSALLARISESFGRKEAPAARRTPAARPLRGGARPRAGAPGHGARPRLLPDRVPRRGARPPREVRHLHRPPAVALPRPRRRDGPRGRGGLRPLPRRASSPRSGARSRSAPRRTEDRSGRRGPPSAVVGLLVIFLFGSHLVYPEIAAIVGLLTARLPAPPGGALGPRPRAAPPGRRRGRLRPPPGRCARPRASRRGAPTPPSRTRPTAGLWGDGAGAGRPPVPLDGRRGGAPGRGARRAALARPPAGEERPPRRRAGPGALYWNDARRGTVDLPHGGWKDDPARRRRPRRPPRRPRADVPPLSRTDGRRLGIETGPPPSSGP